MDMSMAPPDDTFMVIGKASKAALNHKGKREEWFMDSGATNHFCCERDMLHAFVPDDPMHPVYVRIADKTLIKRSGVGNIRSRTCIDGLWYNRELRGVWFVPEFHQNLLSLNKLKDAGCWMITGRQGDKNDYVMGSDDVLWLVTKPNGGLNSPDWNIVKSFVPKTIPTSSHAHLSYAPNASHAPSGISKPCIRKPSLSKPSLAYRSSRTVSFTPFTQPAFPNVVSPLCDPCNHFPHKHHMLHPMWQPIKRLPSCGINGWDIPTFGVSFHLLSIKLFMVSKFLPIHWLSYVASIVKCVLCLNTIAHHFGHGEKERMLPWPCCIPTFVGLIPSAQ
jgi:hypothetical protein